MRGRAADVGGELVLADVATSFFCKAAAAPVADTDEAPWPNADAVTAKEAMMNRRGMEFLTGMGVSLTLERNCSIFGG